MRLTLRRKKTGFTLIELLVIIPVVILTIGALISVVLHLTNSSLRSQARSQLQLDVLSALDRIEQDVKLSAELTTTSSTVLSMRNLATTKNPLDPTRQLIKRADCSVATSGLYSADALKYGIEYSVSGGNYQRKVSLAECTTSSNVWQKAGTEILMKDLTGVTVAITYSGSPIKNKVKVVLTASRKVAGETISYSGVMYVKSMNL